MPISSLNPADTKLPIVDIIDELKSALATHHQVLVQAPPGAGKTTLIPLALAAEPWLGHNKILMLEPRRIATRAAAHRMANLIGEAVGQTIGYRMRLDSRISAYTKIEVITEGILTRMLQDDPSLDGVGLVIFDEFHERSLDGDLALALCLKGRSMFRESNPLKILIMSATLDGTAIANLLDAPIVTSEGKQFPVDIIYGKPGQPRDRIVDKVVASVLLALKDNPNSSILVFLPGQGEIKRVEEALQSEFRQRNIGNTYVKPLYGNLSLEVQQEAIAPLLAPNKRKVVLATNIAETSLTIEGVDVVVDSGLAREPAFDPATGMTRLLTRKISQASSTQRAGRAGRLRPGKCYRLWSQEQQHQMAMHSTPEIMNTDLAPVAMQLLTWGVSDPVELDWLDPPQAGPWQQALELLQALGAVTLSNSTPQLTAHGQSMAQLAMHPRLAHMLIRANAIDHRERATLLASVLADRDPFGQDAPDMEERIAILLGEVACPNQYRGWFSRSHQLAEQFSSQISSIPSAPQSRTEGTLPPPITSHQILGYLIACAFPDRIARARHAGGYQLANGRGATLGNNHPLGRSRWLAIAEVGGAAKSKGDRVRSAAQLDEALFESHLADLVQTHTIVEWDKKNKRFVAEARRQIGSLVLTRTQLAGVPAEAKQAALVKHINDAGLSTLPWSTELRQWQARVELVRVTLADQQWPEVSDTRLLESLAEWLGPYLKNINLLNDFKKLDLRSILESILTFDQSRKLKQLVPVRIKVPSGSEYAIDYTQSPPVLAAKLQEMFGCDESPSVVNGAVPLVVHLLSPAGRPLQVTQDLAGFWRSSYQEVKKEMKGRYPRHPWPDDPLVAMATKNTKKKGG